jgi:hypothetical protein
MRSNSIPTFDRFKDLINESPSIAVADLNELHFQSYFKDCLLNHGFLSVVRSINETTLFLKVYYFEKKVRENKREMEQFVSSYYLHETPQLQYHQCNLIMIPLKFEIDVQAVANQSNLTAMESFLQLQLKPDSWVGIDTTGTTGGLTMGVNPDALTHQRRKDLLKEGYMKPNYEEKVQQWLLSNKVVKAQPIKIQRESDGLNLTLTQDKIILSWESVPLDVQVSYSIIFKWKGVRINLMVLEYCGQRSNTIKAVVQYLGNKYSFGVGRSSVGAGSMGEKPNISIGNNKLKFEFGKRCMSVSDIVIDETLSLTEERESNFQVII